MVESLDTTGAPWCLRAFVVNSSRIHVDGFELGVELDGRRAHFAVAAGAEFEAAEGGLEFEAGGGVVDVDDVGFVAAGGLEGAGEGFGGEAGGGGGFRGG